MKRLMMMAVMLLAMLTFANPTPAMAAGPKACTQHCISCAKSCETSAKALEKKKGDAALIKQLRDCAKICRDYNGKGTKEQAKACADACKACEEACEKSKDASLQSCISECKSCADCCSM